MSTFFFDDNDSVGGGLSKGLLTGALGLAGIYGLNELRNFIMDKLNITPRVYPKDTILKFNLNKTGSLKEHLIKEAINPAAAYTYGLGLPIGAFGAYKLLQYLSNKLHQYDIQSDVRRYDQAVEYSVKKDMENKDEMIKRESLKEELMKDAAIDEYLNKNIFRKQAEVSEDESLSFGDVVKFLGITMPTTYLPILYGAMAPIGAGIGYYGMERIMRDKNVIEDPGKPPRLVFRVDDSKASDDPIPSGELLNKSGGILDQMISGVQNAIAPGSRLVYNKAKDIIGNAKDAYDDVKGGYSDIKNIIGKVKEKTPQIEGLLSGLDKLQNSPLEFLTSNPKLLAGGMGLATMASIPSMAFNHFSNQNLGNKLDKLIGKLDTKNSIADNFKLSNTTGIRS